MLSTDIPQMTSKFVEVVPPSHQQGNYIPFAAIRWHDFGNRPSFGRSFAHIFRHPDTPLPPFFTSQWISSAYAGTGLRRRSSIRLRIFRNRSLDTATSASWKVAYRPWRTTLAPILTSFSRSVVSGPPAAVPTSPVGYKQTCSRPKSTSALPPTPDILVAVTDFRV